MHTAEQKTEQLISFDDIINWNKVAPLSWEGEIDASWMQGRSVFGGVSTGVVLRALEEQCDQSKHQRPLSLSIAFLAPITVGLAHLRIRPLRNGKYIEHWEGEIVQNDQLVYRFLATLGFDRHSSLMTPPISSPSLKEPLQLPKFPYVPNVTPAFTQNYEYRWGQKSFPFSGSDESSFCGWIRPKVTCKPSASLVASLLDAWPPPILLRAKSPIPASTISWHIHFVQPVTTSNWWIYQAQDQVARHGYSNMTDFLWDENLNLIAQSQQVVAEFSEKHT